MLWVLGDWELITIVETLVVMMQQCGATPPVLAQGGITVLLSSVLDVTEVTCEVLRLRCSRLPLVAIVSFIIFTFCFFRVWFLCRALFS